MKKSFRYLSIALFVTAVALIVANAVLIVQQYQWKMPQVVSFCSVIACASGIYYGFSGYKKHAAPCFKFFMLVSALIFLLSGGAAILNMSDVVGTSSVFGVICINLITFVSFLLLTFKRDLGKKVSQGIILFNAILMAVCLISSMILFPGKLIGGTLQGSFYTVRAASKLLVCLMAYVMISGKYADKAARNTK